MEEQLGDTRLMLLKWEPQNPRYMDAQEATCEITGHVYVIVGNDLAVRLNGEKTATNINMAHRSPKEAAEFHRNRWAQDKL